MKLSASRLWKAPAEMSSQQTENYNDCSARQHGVCLTNNIPGKNANESTYEGCAGIKVLDKNIRVFPCHGVTENAAANTGDYAYEDKKKDSVLTGGGLSHLNPYNGENTKTKRIHYKHNLVIYGFFLHYEVLHGRKR